jgi:hypothetical protein
MQWKLDNGFMKEFVENLLLNMYLYTMFRGNHPGMNCRRLYFGHLLVDLCRLCLRTGRFLPATCLSFRPSGITTYTALASKERNVTLSTFSLYSGRKLTSILDPAFMPEPNLTFFATGFPSDFKYTLEIGTK